MIKKIIKEVTVTRIVLSAVLLLMSIACFAQFEDGDGSERNPWQIRSPEQLDRVREFLREEHRDKHFVLIDNIDLDVPPFNEGEGWQPIGSEEEGFFCGNFDGGRYAIVNLMIRRDREFSGFFGSVQGAKIRNVGLKNVSITGGHFVAGLVGRAMSGGGETLIERCYVVGAVRGQNMVGGLVGVSEGPEITIRDCYSVANTTVQDDRVGGLVAETHESRIINCYAIGSIITEHEPHDGMGAVIGMAHGGGEIDGIKFSSELSGIGWGVGGRPDEFPSSTTEQMMRRENYDRYNFDEIWNIRENVSFPYFRWQGEEPEDHNLPPLAPPSELVATPGSRYVTLSWQAPPDELGRPDGYIVYRDDRRITEMPVRETHYRDEGLINFNRYGYKVTAVYGDAQSQSTSTVYAVPFEFAGGRGTENDPYHIRSAQDLNGIRYFDFHFIQTANIDLGVAPWNEDAGWEPIGSYQNHFKGSYDGGNYYISGLTVNRPDEAYSSLFGCIENSIIKRVGLRDVDILGMNAAAGIAGSARHSSIQSCYVTGSIHSFGGIAYTGGIVGYLSEAGCSIYDCYSTATITIESTIANRYVGGIVSLLERGDVRRCYSTGKINANGPGQYVGALIGNVNQQHATYGNLYWNSETCGVEVGIGNAQGLEGHFTNDFLRQNTFEGFDFNTTWNIAQGTSYPFLRWEGDEPGQHNRPPLLPPQNLNVRGGDRVVNLAWISPPDIMGRPLGYHVYRDDERITDELLQATQYQDTGLNNWTYYTYYVTAMYPTGESMPSTYQVALTVSFDGGAGTPQNPYLVSNEQQLNGVRLLLGSHYKQTEDIFIAAETWRPIGHSVPNSTFIGTYDGDGHTISGISMMGDNYLGLFGFVTNGGTLKNIHLEGVHVRQAGLYSGTLAGVVSASSVINCSATGSLVAQNWAGGLVGVVESGGFLSDSWSNVDFTTTRGAGGGLVGVVSHNGSVVGCYSKGGVTSEATTSDIGGLIGWVNSGQIANCYSRSRVTTPTNNSNVGGLIGRNQGNVFSCFAIGRIVSGNNSVGGLIGNNSGNVNSCYWDIELTERETSAGGTGKHTRAMVHPYDGETYTGWNFTTVWEHDPQHFYNSGYPVLRHQLGDHIVLDTPILNIKNVKVAGVERIVITWQVVENANSYKVYASDNPYSRNWGQPVAVVANNEYSEPVSNRPYRYYYVVASASPAP